MKSILRADASNECIGGDEAKFSDEKTIKSNSNNNSCRNMRLAYAFYDGASSPVTKM